MKNLVLSIFFVLLSVSNTFGQTKNNLQNKEVEKMLYSFYSNYFKLFNEPPSAVIQKKLELHQKKFCTKSFYDKIPQIIENTDADVFLKAQDSDISYLKTLKIAKRLKNQYVVSYIADDSMKISIKITLVKEGKNYKINDVE